jgi:hypothetical protein
VFDEHSADGMYAAPVPLKTPRERRTAALAIHGLAVAALLPAFLWLAPETSWDRPELLAALLALAVIADFHDATLNTGIRFDAGMALALIALAVAGPLAAVLVDLFPMVVGGLIRREKLIRAGNLANVAAYGWKAIAAAAVLSLAAVQGLSAEMPWLLLSPPPRCWSTGPSARRSTARCGSATRSPRSSACWPTRSGRGRNADTRHAHQRAFGSIGVLALVVFALIAVLPQSAPPRRRTRPSAAGSAAGDAALRHALALHVGLNHERRHLRASRSSRSLAAPTRAIRSPTPAPRCATRAARAGRPATCEWWNGAGGPAGLRGPVTPLAARIVAVADTWSADRARRPQLSHADALEELDQASGARFDPRIVLAAHSVVAEERVSVTEPAPEPRLHSLRLPAPLRRALAAG